MSCINILFNILDISDFLINVISSSIKLTSLYFTLRIIFRVGITCIKNIVIFMTLKIFAKTFSQLDNMNEAVSLQFRRHCFLKTQLRNLFYSYDRFFSALCMWKHWEGGSEWGTRVHLWRIHVEVWQNQYNIVKLKTKTKTKHYLQK